LSSEGTDHFNKLSDSERKNFYTQLKQELANAIPVRLERITSNGKSEIDNSVSRTILSINIEKGENNEVSVTSAIKDLDILIRKQHFTLIGFGDSSKYLDQEYGYQTFRKNSFIKLLNEDLFQEERMFSKLN